MVSYNSQKLRKMNNTEAASGHAIAEAMRVKYISLFRVFFKRLLRYYYNGSQSPAGLFHNRKRVGDVLEPDFSLLRSSWS